MRALCLLFLDCYLAKSDSKGQVKVSLRGEAGSPARSLDYALAKKPLWLQDLFGCDSNGNSFSPRFFLRRNPEGKRPGPVEVAIAPSMLRPEAITVFLDEVRIDSDDLELLRNAVAASFQVQVHKLRASKSNPEEAFKRPVPDDGSPEFVAIMKPLIQEELSVSLFSSPIFGRAGLLQQLNSIQGSDIFRRVAGNGHDALRWIIDLSTPPIRMGLADPALLGKVRDLPPLRVSVSSITFGSLVLFQYLKSQKGIPVEFNRNFSGGSEIAREIILSKYAGGPDLCVFAAPSAAQVLSVDKNRIYKPIMLMPQHSHRTLTTGKTRRMVPGELHLFSEEPSGSLMYLERLVGSSRISLRDFRTSHCATEDYLPLFKESNPSLQCISWFPLYRLGEMFCETRTLEPPENGSGGIPILLLAHKRVWSDSLRLSCLLSELYSAWIDLQGRPAIRDLLITELLSDGDYLRTLYRSCGLHRMSRHRPPSSTREASPERDRAASE